MAVVEVNEEYLAVDGHKIYVDDKLREPLVITSNGKSLLTNTTDSTLTCNITDEYKTLHQFMEIHNLPGLVGAVGLPDIHHGYAFPVGTVAAIDLENPQAAICPEGVGFDINCGVRCLISNIQLDDIKDKLDDIADSLQRMVPNGTEDGFGLPGGLAHLNEILENGLKGVRADVLPLSLRDIQHTESCGSLSGNSRLVGQQAKARGLSHIGTLGGGNHYLEVQAIDEIMDQEKAEKMGLRKGQIVISIHTGSRGLGYSVCSDFLKAAVKAGEDAKKYGQFREMEGGLKNVGSLTYVDYHSGLGEKYVSVMNAAANYAWANRALIAQRVRDVFAEAQEGCRLELLSDVCHNIAKIEEQDVGGKSQKVLVHRKGAARALPPGHPEVPEIYREVGLPVFVGGSMGTCSYILAGAEGAVRAFYSTCHGAGRLLPRGTARSVFTYEEVVADLNAKGIVFRDGSKKGLIEEACDCYKDVNRVVEHSAAVGLTVSVARVRPIIVIKG